MSGAVEWPALPYDEWSDTHDTLQMILQILGKVRVALSPKEPEWAHITLFVSARGLTTGPVPSNVGLFDVEADLLHHEVVIRTADGEAERRAAARLARWRSSGSSSSTRCAKLGVDVELSHLPQEVPDPIPFPDDTTHRAYDPAAATRFWQVLTLIEPVFAEYRAAFEGKVSRVQFFWGHADLAVTRFSGEPCTPPAGAGPARARDLRLRADERRLVGRRRVVHAARVLRVRAIRSPKASTTPTSACPAPRGTPSSASSCSTTTTSAPRPHPRRASASSSTPPTPPAPPAATGTPASTPDLTREVIKSLTQPPNMRQGCGHMPQR